MRIIIISLFIICNCYSATPMEVFEQQSEAVLNKDIDTYMKLLSPDSSAYMGELINLARFGERADVDARNYTDKIKIFSIRHEYDRDFAKTMSVKDFFKYDLTKNSDANKKAMDMMKDLRTNFIDDNHANIMWEFMNQEHVVLMLVKENDSWLIDYRPFFQHLDKTVSASMKSLNMTEDEFIKLGLKGMFGQDLDFESLYVPIGGNKIELGAPTKQNDSEADTAKSTATEQKAAESSIAEEPQDTSLGAVSSFSAGAKSIVNLSVGTDLNFQKGDVVYIKRDGKLLCKATLTRLRSNKSIAEIKDTDWAEGAERKLQAGDKVYDK